MSLPETCKAAQWTEFPSTPDTIKIVDVPVKKPSSTQIVVKNSIAALNPVDAMVQAGWLKPAGWKSDPPFTPGYDFAGKVVAVGDSVSDFKVGDEVFGTNWGQANHNIEPQPAGALSEYITVESSVTLKRPSELSPEKAAGLALVGTTAYEGIYAKLEVKKGDRVVILGGSTVVGRMAIAMCKDIGAWVATTASPRNFDYVKEMNPDLVIDYTKDKSWADYDEVQGCDCVLSIPASDGLTEAKKALKKDGRFAAITNQEAGFDPSAHPPLAHAATYTFSANTKYLQECVEMVKRGLFDVTIDGEYPFTHEGIQALYAKQGSNKSNGKNIVKF